MAKQQKPKLIPKGYYCRTGNHFCYRTEIAVFHGDYTGICYACIKKRGELRDYWK